METRSEINRLLEVYREYEVRGYGISKWSPDNKGNRAVQEECHFKLRTLLQNRGFLPLKNRRVLEVGCGTGEHLSEFWKMGATPQNLFGIDLIAGRIGIARRNYPQFNFEVANAEALPFADESFDLVAVFTVFTSILDRRMAANVCQEITRVLAAGGGVVWYDFRLHSPLNRHVRGISYRGIKNLFPGFSINLQAISLLPPLARRLGRLTDLLYQPLCSVPILRSHYLGLLTKP
jgi:ubiquinone/menaquinone biosynthesis C-methylase UbiE